MSFSLTGFLEAIGRRAPEGSTTRKLIQLLSIILVFEGLSVLFLSSKFGYGLGVVSIAVGIMLIMILPPSISKKAERKEQSRPVGPEPVGIRLVERIMAAFGDQWIIVGLGAMIIALDIAFNTFVSTRSNYGDLDTLSIMFGAVLAIYPFAVKKFRVEIIFTLMFIALVVVMLVVPQAVIAIGSAEGSTAGNWYVHYMLAAPFAGALNLMGIHASSAQEWVTITFQDGTVQTLGISTACAGLYSFSIFVAAFFSFVLVFERLPNRIMALVLVLGILAAYLGNLFRMIIIGVVGYFDGMDALIWAHKNVGWIVFLGWSAVFWYLVMYCAEKKARKAPTDVD